MEEGEIIFASAPYPGLRPFHADEKDVFFGRESQSDDLLQKLGQSHFISIIGTSGCGKSSLLRAGLIADLETGFLSSAGARWRIADMRPGDQPLNRLAEVLLRDSALGPERGNNLESLALTQATLRRGPLGLIEILRETPLPERTNLLIVVDQFEEIFRYHREVNNAEAEAFVALLLASAAEQELPIYIVIAMRSEFLGECAVFADFPQAINASSFLIPRMSRDQRREAVEKPARVVGGQVESELVNHLLNDMGSNPDQLPLMQHAMMRMWNLAKTTATYSEPSNINHTHNSSEENGRIVLTLRNHYERIGRLTDALSNHADEAYEELSGKPEKHIAEVMFRCLSGTGKSGQRDLRNPMQLARVAKIADASYEDVVSVVEVFRRHNRNFVTPAEGIPLTPETYLDISHESLIRNWERLKNWVDLEAESADQYQRLRDTARLWKKGSAGLWRSPDLDVALKWKEREKPTSAWSQRYGGDFDITMEFLTASEQKRKNEEAERQRDAEEDRQRELSNARAEEKRLQEEAIKQRELEQIRALAEEQKRRAALAEQLALEQRQRADLADEKRRREEAARRLLLFQRAALVVLAAIVVIALIYTSKQKTLLDSRILGDRSLSHLQTGRLDLSLLLSLEAYLRADTFEARNSLMSGVLQGLEGSLRNTLLLSSVPKPFTSAILSPGGKWLALGGDNYRILLWDLTTNSTNPLHVIEHGGTVTSIAFSEDSKIVASSSCQLSETQQETIQACRDGEIRLWDITTTPRLIRSLAGYTTAVLSLAFSANGKSLASGSADNQVTLWDLTSNPPKNQVLSGHNAPVYSVAFGGDGKTLASGSCKVAPKKHATTQVCSEGEIRLWNLAIAFPQLSRALTGHTAPVLSLAFNPKSMALASGGADNMVILWDSSTWKPSPLIGHGGPVQSVTFSRDGKLLASGSSDSKITLWDLSTDPPRGQPLICHKASVRNLAFASDARSVISVSEDNTVNVWNTASLKPTQSATTSRQVTSVAFSEDGKIFASSSCRLSETQQDTTQECADREIRLWDNTTIPRLIESLAGDRTPVLRLAFSADGKSLASGSADNQVTLWDLTSNPPKKQILLGHKAAVYSLAFSGDGKTLASGSADNTVILWNLAIAPPQIIRTLTGHTAPVLSLAFNPKSKALASGGADNMVILWDSSTWKPFPPLTGHGGPVQSVTFSRDGKLLASGSSDNKIVLWSVSNPKNSTLPAVLLWNVNTPEPRDRLGVSQARLSTNAGVTSLAFSPDNKFLASVSPELGILLWGVAKGKPFTMPITSFGSNLLGIAFNQDGQELLSRSSNDDKISWDMTPKYWKEQACKIAGRNFKSSEWEDELDSDIGIAFYHRPCPDLPYQNGEPPNTMMRRTWERVLEGWYGSLSLLP